MMKRMIPFITFLALSFSMVHAAAHLAGELTDQSATHHHEHCPEEGKYPKGESLEDPCFEQAQAVKSEQVRTEFATLYVLSESPLFIASSSPGNRFEQKAAGVKTPFALHLSGKVFLLI